MANTNENTTAVWIEGGSDYTPQNCNPKMREALNIHAMALELAAIGGTDYSTDFESLIAASDALNHYMNPAAIEAAEVSINYANATAAGASPPAAIGDKLEAAKALLHYDDERLKRAKLFLKGALGYHSSF